MDVPRCERAAKTFSPTCMSTVMLNKMRERALFPAMFLGFLKAIVPWHGGVPRLRRAVRQVFLWMCTYVYKEVFLIMFTYT